MQLNKHQFEWVSAHIHYKDSAHALLCRFIQPFITQATPLLHSSCPYFFIRYNEGGPHIQLRLQTRQHHINQLKELLEASLYHSVHIIHYIPYITETGKYGHETTLQLAEALFHASSMCCLQCLTAQEQNDTATALRLAWQMHLAFFHALQHEPDAVQQHCRQFTAAWLKVLQKKNTTITHEQLLNHMHTLYNRQAHALQPAASNLWNQLETAQAPEPFETYAKACRSLLLQYNEADWKPGQLAYAIRSLLHMTNNRLGIPNSEEAWCLFITGKCIQYIYERQY